MGDTKAGEENVGVLGESVKDGGAALGRVSEGPEIGSDCELAGGAAATAELDWSGGAVGEGATAGEENVGVLGEGVKGDGAALGRVSEGPEVGSDCAGGADAILEPDCGGGALPDGVNTGTVGVPAFEADVEADGGTSGRSGSGGGLAGAILLELSPASAFSGEDGGACVNPCVNPCG